MAKVIQALHPVFILDSQSFKDVFIVFTFLTLLPAKLYASPAWLSLVLGVLCSFIFWASPVADGALSCSIGIPHKVHVHVLLVFSKVVTSVCIWVTCSISTIKITLHIISSPSSVSDYPDEVAYCWSSMYLFLLLQGRRNRGGPGRSTFAALFFGEWLKFAPEQCTGHRPTDWLKHYSSLHPKNFV